MSHVRIGTAVFVACVLLRSNALADPREDGARELDAPTAASTTGSFASKAILDASSDKTTATLKLGRLRPVDGSASKLRSFGLVAKTPFDSEKDDTKDIGTSSGLTVGGNLRLEYGFLNWPQFSADAERAMGEICSRYIGRVLPSYYWSREEAGANPERNLARSAADKSCADLLSADGIAAVVKKINDDAEVASEKNKTPLPPKLAPIPGYEAILKEGAEMYAQRNASGFTNAWGLTFAVTGNRQKFAYSSEATPTETTEETRSGRGVSITYNLIRHSSIVGIGASYERAYTGGTEVEICSPIGATGSLKCANGSLTAPERKSDRLVFVEYRSVLKQFPSFAISPRLEYAHRDSAFSFSLPIYLSADENRVLDGGLSINWDEKEHMNVAVFIGKAFKFFD